MTRKASIAERLNGEVTALKILEALLAEHPDREVGFFQRSVSQNDVFQPEQTYIGFDLVRRTTFKNDVDPFITFQAMLPELRIGYLAYDSIRFREPVLDQALGAFSKLTPDFNYGEAAVFDKYFVINHKKNEVTFLTQNSQSAAAPFRAVLDLASKIKKSAPSQSDAELLPEELQSSLGPVAFKNGVRKLQEHIRAGDIFQAVLSERFEVPLQVSALEVFKTLLDVGASAYQFFFSTPERTVLGASPELLLGVKNGKMETHPIAGTRPRGKTKEDEKRLENELLNDTKENAEHLMLVDLSRNDVGRIAKTGTVEVSERAVIKKFPSVMHIVSKVTGDLKPEGNAIEALGSCFPAGTLSGAPKIRAMQLISEIEGKPRGFYGGAFFLIQPGNELEACIAIRSMEIKDGVGYIQAGAGIVMDSDPDSEYQEVLHKTKTLRRTVALAHLNRRKS